MGVRVGLKAGGFFDRLFPMSPPHPHKLGSTSSHIPVGDRGFHFWGDSTRDLGSGAAGTVRSGAFTEDRN